MNRQPLLRRKITELILVFSAIMVALFALTFVMACDTDDSNPARSPECGSGIVDWDSKAQVCRDRSNGVVVPSFCCGR